VLPIEVNENPFRGAQKARGERKKKIRNGSTTRRNKTKDGPLILKTTYLTTMKNAEEKGLLLSKDFTWSNGAVYCSYCNNRIRNAKHITQHAKGKKHKKKKQRLRRGQKHGALLSLFRLKHEDLAHDILDCIHKRLALPVSDWQTVQLDRASVNKAAINKIRTEILDANH
jgi:hypothetical protein